MEHKALWFEYKESKKYEKKYNKAKEQAEPTFESWERLLKENGILCGTLEEIRLVSLINFKKKKWGKKQWMKIPFYE